MVREDTERICSVLRFDGNKPVSVLHKSVGPLQNRERCMLSDRPSLKLPVPHLGQVDILKKCGTNQMIYEESCILYFDLMNSTVT